MIPLLLFVVACGAEDSEEIIQDDTATIQDTLQQDSLIEENYVTLPEIDWDKTYDGNILMPGTYHDDEVMEDVEKLVWFGVYRGLANGLEIAEANLKGERVNDGIMDGEDEASGWEISDMNRENAIFYVTGLDYLSAQESEELSLDEYTVYPGQEQDFIFQEGTLTLYAEGESEKVDDYYTAVSDYKLFASAIIEGEEIEDLLIEYSGFDDSMVSILFVGDIDGDGFPDLLTNNTYHYNVSIPTLYLSRPAKSGYLYKLVASHNSVGC